MSYNKIVSIEFMRECWQKALEGNYDWIKIEFVKTRRKPRSTYTNIKLFDGVREHHIRRVCLSEFPVAWNVPNREKREKDQVGPTIQISSTNSVGEVLHAYNNEVIRLVNEALRNGTWTPLRANKTEWHPMFYESKDGKEAFGRLKFKLTKRYDWQSLTEFLAFDEDEDGNMINVPAPVDINEDNVHRYYGQGTMIPTATIDLSTLVSSNQGLSFPVEIVSIVSLYEELKESRGVDNVSEAIARRYMLNRKRKTKEKETPAPKEKEEEKELDDDDLGDIEGSLADLNMSA